MNENPAQVSYLAARGYVLTEENTPIAQTWLDVAWRALNREVPGVAAIVAAGEADDVADVVCAAALRVLRNPEGFDQESGAIDDYTESWHRVDATRDVYFTAAELRRLQPAVVPTAGSFKYC